MEVMLHAAEELRFQENSFKEILLSLPGVLVPAPPKPLFLITEVTAMLLFASFGLFTVRRHRNPSAHSTVRPQVNECN
jgi:hypothetical protein